MTRQSPIDFEDVAAAADACRQAGQGTTLRGVHARLGRGSLSTVSRHLQTWLAAQPKAAASPAALPDGLVRSLTAWIAAERDAARAEVAAEVASLKDERDLLGEVNADLDDQRQSLESRVVELQAAVAGRDGQIAQYQVQVEGLRKDLAVATDASQEARSLLVKAELRLEVLPRLEQELEQLRTAIDDERLARAEAVQGMAVRQAQLTAAENQASAAREEADRFAAQLGVALSRIDELSNIISNSLAASQADLRAANAAIASLRAEAAPVTTAGSTGQVSSTKQTGGPPRAAKKPPTSSS